MNRFLPRVLLAPAVLTLFLWMIVPLVMTIYFSLIRYNLMQPEQIGFIGLENFDYFLTDPSFGAAVINTPPTTVIRIALPTSSSVLMTAAPKDGSVRK